ncbi:MAG: GNAT family N-acetyltransferase [Bacteroidota bacterium]
MATTLLDAAIDAPISFPLSLKGEKFQGARYRVLVHLKAENLPSCWIDLSASDYFLHPDYLKAIEFAAPKNMQFRYCTILKDDQALGVVNCQIMHFKASESIADDKNGQLDACFFQAVATQFNRILARNIKFNTLVCGNLLLTGEHAFAFDETQINHQHFMCLLAEAMKPLRKEIKKHGTSTQLTLIKDFFEDKQVDFEASFSKQAYKSFAIQPNMILPIRSNWLRFEDYLADMQSKYRVRAKRAFKKGRELEKRELTLDNLSVHKERLYELYLGIAESSGFNAFILSVDYFLSLKRELGDRFEVHAYFLADKLVGFYTLIQNHEELEANFLGYDKSINHPTQAYLNMLYDMIRRGIELQVKRIIFARTALEIKSSVGAEPFEMYGYMQHKNTISNRIMNGVFNMLNTQEEWVQRKPFKEPITESE